MSPVLQNLRKHWAALAPRERLLAAGAAALVALALLWWVALGPALRTLSAAPDERARLDLQLQQMRTLQAQAKTLQTQPRASRDDAQRALSDSLRQGLGGKAQLQNTGDSASVTLRGVDADALAQWLAQTRANAHALPREAHLTRSKASGGGGTDAAADGASIRWDGSLVLSLPAPR